MAAAAERLSGQLTDAKSVALETEAWSRLRDVAQAIKTESASETSEQSQPQSPENDRPGGAESIAETAQWILLRALQQDLLKRTVELDRKRRDEPKTSRATSDAEANQLAVEQNELADLISRIAARSANTRDAAPTGAAPKGP